MVSLGRWRDAQKAEWKFWLGQQGRKDVGSADFWNRFILEPFNELFSLPKKVLIDVGCGPAGLINYVDGEIRIGVDPLANNYKRCFDIPPEIQLIRAIGEKLPFRDRIANIMFCINTLDHTKSPEEVVMEIRRILCNDGALILQVYTYPLTSKIWHGIRGTYDVYHPRFFTARNVELMLQRTGFNNLKSLYEKRILKSFIRNIIIGVGFIFSKSLFASSVKIIASA